MRAAKIPAGSFVQRINATEDVFSVNVIELAKYIHEELDIKYDSPAYEMIFKAALEEMRNMVRRTIKPPPPKIEMPEHEHHD